MKYTHITDQEKLLNDQHDGNPMNGPAPDSDDKDNAEYPVVDPVEDDARADLKGAVEYPDKNPEDYTYEDYLRAVEAAPPRHNSTQAAEQEN